MSTTTRIDLHLHSCLSDGKLRPEEFAAILAHGKVAAAALTDHDTLEGLPAFERAMRRRGIGCISGVEITAWLDGRETHLLAYGFDPENRELLATLASVRQARAGRLQSIEAGVRERAGTFGDAPSVAPTGRLDIVEAIRLVHRSGGLAVLAHPLQVIGDIASLDPVIARLAAAGLDGIEAIYGEYDHAQRDALIALANRHNLLVSAGSDYHEDREAGMDIPNQLWKALRDRVNRDAAMPSPGVPSAGRRQGRRRFIFHILFPAGLAILLFVLAIWGFFLPTFERSLLDRKREMIRELANSTWGIIAEAYQSELRGEMTREEAQRAAATRIEVLRYGREGKDYFWVQDTTPRMIMHPYRKDLNGRDVSDFTDPRGVRIFVEFADLVRRQNGGYVEYVWQWKDDPRRLVPKESYVKGFDPWGWIIGTGLYTDDVMQETARIERNLLWGLLAIAAVMGALLFYVVRESQRLEQERSDAEEHLAESHQRYHSLVEATNEGMLLIVTGRCRYANAAMLRLLGAQDKQLELMDLDDVLPHIDDNAAVREAVARVKAGEQSQPAMAGWLADAAGNQTRAMIAVNAVQLGRETGLVLRASGGKSLPQRNSPRDGQTLAVQIAEARTPEQVVELCQSTPPLADALAASGHQPNSITSAIASICDAATRRLVELAQDSLGHPPMAFAFVAMGSQGRREQTLFTDQDNAIILADAPKSPADQAYFAELGAFVTRWLDAAGYRLCRGEIMARNAKWCQPPEVWRRYFRDWIEKPEPAELRDISICFDLRAVYGETRLATEMREQINLAVRETPGFLPHMARGALEFKAPMRLFGRIVSGDTPGKLDLKDAMMPIVSFARLYALRHGLAATNTLERLRELENAGALAQTTRSDLAMALEFLTGLRLKRQLSCLSMNQPMDNAIDQHRLGHVEMAMLRESLGEIDTVQRKISYEFLGGMGV